jgi:hypothetical protein
MIPTAAILGYDDRCHRAGWRSLHDYHLGPQGIMPILREAVDVGLGAADNRPGRAGMALRAAAINRRLETDAKEGIYNISEHLAALAEQVVYVVGGEKPWTRPRAVWLDSELTWEPSCWLDPVSGGLRRVVLTTKANRAEWVSWWAQGEQAIYGGTMTEIVVVLGQQREGRFHGYWSKGWKHPKSKEVRLSDIAGGEFRSWDAIWREDERIGEKDWGRLMGPTMHLAMFIQEWKTMGAIERVRWKALAVRKLKSMRAKWEPDPQLSQCNTPGKCPFGPCMPPVADMLARYR